MESFSQRIFGLACLAGLETAPHRDALILFAAGVAIFAVAHFYDLRLISCSLASIMPTRRSTT